MTFFFSLHHFFSTKATLELSGKFSFFTEYLMRNIFEYKNSTLYVLQQLVPEHMPSVSMAG
jgi:hypothetical protein